VDLTIACNLTDREFQQRREELLQKFQGLELTGPIGAKDFLNSIFGAQVTDPGRPPRGPH
jgi:hypothetical protein